MKLFSILFIETATLWASGLLLPAFASSSAVSFGVSFISIASIVGFISGFIDHGSLTVGRHARAANEASAHCH